VGSWEPGPVIRVAASIVIPAAFSRDGGLMAVSDISRTVRLVDPATGREIATLAAPDSGLHTRLCFSPDGSQLAVATETQTIQLWDLRLIRRQLATMNLDWDLTPPAPRVPPIGRAGHDTGL
jgi:WD40 repeat protein